MKIAIDGPAGSGKSTIAKLLAKELDFEYLDTGALYRGVALLVQRSGFDLEMEEEIADLIRYSRFEFRHNHLYLDGVSIEEDIRRNEISQIVSKVAARPFIRRILTEIERQIAHTEPNVILDGRDIGTVVLPDAEVKIFLTASSGERARRRQLQLEEKGERIALETIEAEIIRRDHLDSTREEGPLKQASDAVRIDTDSLSIDEVVGKILEIVRKQLF